MTNIVDIKALADSKAKEKAKEPPKATNENWHVCFKLDDGSVKDKLVVGVIANLMPMLIIIDENAPADPNSANFILPCDKLQFLEKIEVPQAQEA